MKSEGLKGFLSRLSQIDQAEETADEIVELIERSFSNQRLLTFASLSNSLSVKQHGIIDWILTLRPADFNLRTPFYGLEEPADGSHFVAVSQIMFDGEGKKYKTVQYVPLQVYKAFDAMRQAFFNSYPGKQFILYSAYRSPAYQTLLIIYYATKKDYDLTKVLQRVALPGYSEHGLIESTALDLDDATHHPADYDDAEFANTIQYEWLIANAASFGFHLSYPKNNSDGIDYEPWHWRFKG